MNRLLTVLYKLFRFKPTIAWSLCGIILGVSVAVHEKGINLMWNNIIIAVFPVILMQGFIAHAINDLEDEEVDKKTDIVGTKRFKVLVAGIASRYDLIVMTVFLLIVTSFSAIKLYIIYGYPIAIFYFIALYAALGYSLPPLKLGWKPFSELTIVLPVLVTLVVAVDFVATGKLSYLSFIIGILFALFNIVWFLVSRMMDYEADKNAGKITTFVKIGLDYKESPYQYNTHPYLTFVIFILFLLIVYVSVYMNLYIGMSSFLMLLLVRSFVPLYKENSPIVLSIKRTWLIIISVMNSILVSLILIFLR